MHAAVKRALLVIVVLLAVPAAASAYTPQQTAQWQSIADQTWGGACAGRLHADVVSELSTSDDGAGFATLGQAHVNDATTCTYQIVSGLSAYQACVVTFHEAGHLAGYRAAVPAINPDGSLDWAHDRGATIMNPHPTDVFRYGAFKPCAGFAPPVLSRSAAFNWVEGTWVMASSECRRESPSRFRCWGHTVQGTRILVIVRMDNDYRVRGKRRMGGRLK